MTRLIVVEGPDGAGKSTLLKRLSIDLSREVFHTGGPKTEEESQRWMMKIRNVADKPMIADRVPYISDPIYQRICYDNTSSYDDRRPELLEVNPVLVYCRLQSVPAMFELMNKETKPHKSPEHLHRVLTNYDRIVRAYDETMTTLETAGMNVFRYDWMQDSYADLLKELDQCAA